jgi:hemerythrin-like domain-containing protein
MSELLSELQREHEHILLVLAALDDFARFFASEDPRSREAIREFVSYLRGYVDGWHHHKEEDVLFVAMIDAGFAKDSGPVGCMLQEHELGREHVRALAAIGEGAGRLSADELSALVTTTNAYARLLSAHIAKENQMLYPMARRAVTSAQIAALSVARAGEDAGAARKLESIGDGLIARYAVARTAAARA